MTPQWRCTLPSVDAPESCTAWQSTAACKFNSVQPPAAVSTPHAGLSSPGIPGGPRLGLPSTESLRTSPRARGVIAHSQRCHPPGTVLTSLNDTGRGMLDARPGKTISHFRNSGKAISPFRSHFLAHLLQHANTLWGSMLQEAWQADRLPPALRAHLSQPGDLKLWMDLCRLLLCVSLLVLPEAVSCGVSCPTVEPETPKG